MTDLDDLYEEVILDHYREPHHYGKPEGANLTAEGYNPLCGDQVTVHVAWDDDRIAAVGFEGMGCAISTASASIMTDVVQGLSRSEIDELAGRINRLLTGLETPDEEDESVGDAAVLAGVSRFPTRVKCATLGWHTLQAALSGATTPVSTE